jgi:hypothetical protein
MGVVKFLGGSGGTPTPPTYLNYVGMVSGSFANSSEIIGTDGDIIIPLNNQSRFTTTTALEQNTTYLNFTESGQDIQFYVVKINLVVDRVNLSGGSVADFYADLFIDDERVGNAQTTIDSFGTIQIILNSAKRVNSTAYVVLRTDGNYYLLNCNWLCYSTGNVTPPPACQYYQNIGSAIGIGQCTFNGLTPSPAPTNFPLVAQGNNWRTSVQFGNYRPKVRFISSIPVDPSAPLIDGETYYVEATFSQTCNTNVLLYFGTSGTNPDITAKVNYSALILGNTTSPQGFYLVWNPDSSADGYFLFGLQNGLSLANSFNGTLTFNIGTQYCPI